MASEAAFDAVAASAEHPAYVVTLRHGDRLAGCLVGFAGRVSIDPPRFLACLSERNRTYRLAADGAEHLAVHLLPPERRDVAELFGGQTGDELDKFARCAWHEGPCGQPLLDACPDRFVGRVLERIALGDHVGFLLEPVAAERADGGAMPLGEVMDVEPGHAP